MTSLLFSCEHATCAIPEAHRELFRGSEELVTSREGWEPGALNLAQGFAMRFRTPLVHGEVTRLLVDLEQPASECWSRFSEKLPQATRLRLADRHHSNYRNLLKQRIAEDLRRYQTVLHIFVHVDEVTDGKIIFATDPKAELAHQIADRWAAAIRHPELGVLEDRRPLAPLAQELSGMFAPESYAQISIHASRSFFLAGAPWRWERIKKHLLDGLTETMNPDSTR